jgi:hypothetical protein
MSKPKSETFMSRDRAISFTPVCYGILKPDGELWMSESCICEDADILRNEELPGINEEVAGKCKVVRLYVREMRRQ